jgi:hypothetical protein
LHPDRSVAVPAGGRLSAPVGLLEEPEGVTVCVPNDGPGPARLDHCALPMSWVSPAPASPSSALVRRASRRSRAVVRWCARRRSLPCSTHRLAGSPGRTCAGWPRSGVGRGPQGAHRRAQLHFPWRLPRLLATREVPSGRRGQRDLRIAQEQMSLHPRNLALVPGKPTPGGLTRRRGPREPPTALPPTVASQA